MFSKSYNIIIDNVISESVHIKEVAYELNTTDKQFLFNFMETAKLPGSTDYDKQIPFTQPLRILMLV